MQEKYPSLLVDLSEHILLVTVNRPRALNALNPEVMQGLSNLFGDIENDDEVRGVIITGAGDRAFIAGADIKGFSFDLLESKKTGAFGHALFDSIEAFRKPVIAAINGFALGGGCELAMACHIRVAGDHAKFGQPEINLGLIPGYGGTQRLPRLVGKGRALELLLTGDLIDVHEAHRIGLVNKVVSAGTEIEAARMLLQKILAKAPISAGKIIDLVNLHFEDAKKGFEEEISAFGQCFSTEDAREGIQAFIEKRKPNFKGK